VASYRMLYGGPTKEVVYQTPVGPAVARARTGSLEQGSLSSLSEACESTLGSSGLLLLVAYHDAAGCFLPEETGGSMDIRPRRQHHHDGYCGPRDGSKQRCI